MIVPKTSGKLGTGFIVSIHNNDVERLFLVTCKHVAFQKTNLDLVFHTTNARTGELLDGCVTLSVATNAIWEKFDNKDLDIAVLDISDLALQSERNGIKIYTQAIPVEKLATQEDFASIGLLEDVYYFGYPIGIFDPANGTPIARKGHLASDINKSFKRAHRFYIDGSLTEGMSGCPIYYIKETSNGPEFLILGIGYGQAQQPYQFTKGIIYEEPVHLGMANKAYVIKQLIEKLI